MRACVLHACAQCLTIKNKVIMEIKKNLLVEYYAGAECEALIVRQSGGESRLFSSCDEFVEFLRSAPAALSAFSSK